MGDVFKKLELCKKLEVILLFLDEKDKPVIESILVSTRKQLDSYNKNCKELIGATKRELGNLKRARRDIVRSRCKSDLTDEELDSINYSTELMNYHLYVNRANPWKQKEATDESKKLWYVLSESVRNEIAKEFIQLTKNK